MFITQFFFFKKVCQMNEKAQIIKTVLQTVFHKVNTVSPNTTSLKLSTSLREYGVFLHSMLAYSLYQLLFTVFVRLDMFTLNNIVFNQFGVNGEIS